MSNFTDLLGLKPAEKVVPAPKPRPKHIEPTYAPQQQKLTKKEILSMFPTVTEIKNFILAKGKNKSADERKTLGRITKEAIHIDRLIATIKEMMMQ